ncbi:MAG TPA: protein kinase [Thermoanaerobaculia bacterium]|nr:protein kinase [Thermoanaerobaculia bacterium]
MTLSPGTKLGPYEIVGPLGAGGMGEVYRAKDARLGREAAIKVLPASLAGDAERLKRFEQEARSASALNHPNIITIYEIGSSGADSYIAMELVEGQSLRAAMASGAMPTRKMLDIGAQIADGLAKAHAAGIVHRDLKPENVMISKDGFVKLLDFGLAKLFVAPTETSGAATFAPQETQPGTVLGTVGYMSPEQAAGRPVDFRSDQFALGSILYEMATGQRAFQKATGAETLSAIIRDEPESVERLNPRAPAPLRWIVERCHAKDPEDRYASSRDLARDLKSIRDHLSETTATSQAHEIERPKAPSGVRGMWIAAGLVLTAAAGFLAAKRLAAPSQPTFQRLTFQRGTVVSAFFGPDGQTVYYTAAWEGNAPRIFSLRPGTPESAALTLPPASLLAISSAGEIAVQLEPKVATTGFALSGTLARAPLSGGAPKEVLTDVSYADWVPGRPDLAVVHHVSGKDRLEFPIGKVLYETGGWIQGPRFSRDGKQIAFIEHPGNGDDGAVAVVDLASKRKTDLAGGFATVQGLAWGPNGREIWFTAAREGIEREIFAVTAAKSLRLVRTMQGTPALLDLRPDGSALLTEDDYRSSAIVFLPSQATGKDLSWFDWSSDRTLSPDGKFLLFDESGEGGGATGGVYLRATDGSPAVRLADGTAVALAPDGAWALTRSGAPSHFVLVPVRAGQPRDFSPDGFGALLYGAFFPDGQRFAFEASLPGKGTRLYVQELAGGAARPISTEGINPSRNFVSPDGKWILAIGPDFRVHLYPADGGTPRDIDSSKPDDYPAGWTADGKGIYVARQGLPCPVDLIDVDSGRRTRIRELGGPDPAGVTSFGPARVTPDGKTMLIGQQRVLSTLYRIKNLK